MRPIRLISSAILLFALCWTGARRAGPLPPLGPLVDPVNGAWGAVRAGDVPAQMTGVIPGLTSPVTVTYDDRAVPHIAAATVEDAYRALGWVVARDRLFQLEVQARASAGTMSELSSAALRIDTVARRIGLGWSAERKFAMLPADGPERRSIDAYAAGVNAWIAQMKPWQVPVEYKLLGKQPMHWEAKYTLYFLSRMNQTLSFLLPELNVMRAQALVGRAAAEQLYAAAAAIQEPIQPNGQKAARFDLTPLPPPGAPDTSLAGSAKALAMLTGAFGGALNDEPERRAASNNWAVSPRRTKNGYAILSGDPHLELSLPSIWYEVHLHVKNDIDAYGFTFAGTPSIVLGFNRDVAWSATNTGADVLDLYRETVDDAAHPTRYKLDGAWVPLEVHEEAYMSPGGRRLLLDTLYYTHRGPMRPVNGRWLSMRWTAHDTTNAAASIAVFQRAQRATSVQTLMEAMKDYVAPAQNFIMADRAGSIGIRSTGKYPIRPGDGSGLVIRDGSTRASDWTGYWPLDAYPQSINPAQGYLASANQQPIDPKVNPKYFGADWPAPFRAMRINQRLRADSAWTPDAIRRMQTDSGSARADLFVPEFMGAVERVTKAGKGSAELTRAAALLGEWTRSYTPDDRRAVLFEVAMERLSSGVWDELIPSDSLASNRPRNPGSLALARLLKDPTSPWWDDHRTPGTVETKDDMLCAALDGAMLELLKGYGEPSSDTWRWGTRGPMTIHHLLRLAPFGVTGIEARSGPETIAPRAANGTYSASERLVVETGPVLHAWTTYPGGQSGNPFSKYYKNRIQNWATGQLDSALFGEVPASRTIGTLTLVPAGTK